MSAPSKMSISKWNSPARSKSSSMSVDSTGRASSPRSMGRSPSPVSRLPVTSISRSASPESKVRLAEKSNSNKNTMPESQSTEWGNINLMNGLESGHTLNASLDTYNCEDKDTTNSDPALNRITNDAVNKLARLLSSKKRKFLKIRRELIAQQKSVLETFANIKDMEKKAKIIGAVGRDDISLEDMKIVDIGSWGGYDIRLLTRDKLGPETLSVDSFLGASVMREVVMRLSSVPEDVSALCAEYRTQLRAQVEYFTNRNKIDKILQGDGIKKRVSELNTEIDKLENKSESTLAAIRAKLEQVADMTKIAWTDRDQLVKRVEKTKRDLLEAQRMEEPAGDGTTVSPNEHNIESALRAQLARERKARETMKASVSGAESTLRAARTKIADLEKQIKDTQAELEHSRTKYRELEQMSRHRQSSLEISSKKMKEASKSGEATIETLTKQRDALELRVKELVEQLSMSDSGMARRLAEEQGRYAVLEARAAEHQRALVEAETRARAAIDKRREAERVWAQLQDRCNNLLTIQEQRRAEFLPPSQGGSVSEHEVELWKELQSSRLALGRAREEVRKARLDKEQFLQQLTKIAQKEENSVQGRIAEEFIEKERINSKLLEKNAILEQKQMNLEQKVSSYESQISNLKLQVKKLENYTCNTAARSNEDLHTQVMELQIEVSRSHAERNALERAAMESRLLLERHERAAALQRRAVRLREELLLIMQHPGDTPSRTALRAQQVASATTMVRNSDAEQTWSVLQSEHARVMRLEQLVSRQHEQLRRCNSERCKLEQSRSSLERQLNQHQNATRQSQ